MTKIERNNSEWRSLLSPEQYHVLREQGTERAGTGPHLDEKRAGTFICAGCGTPLYRSETKYESGSGWPSFYAPASGDSVREYEDRKLFMRRVEIRCATCDGHLGHVFNDGPQPTGKRYCMNGHALGFQPDKET
ncbi:COG0229 Conserved domain frequently associated with peptide methionine sulfoxide reductase [Rhabdaerophilaceae bacterium]